MDFAAHPIANTVGLIGLAGVAFGLFMLVRNQWVYDQRTYVLWNVGLRAYDRLPSYDAMMWRFWVWDISKFMEAPRG